MGEFDELIEEFVTESREHIADIEEDLIRIEADIENVDPEVINRVFRAAHSIKGSARFLDLVNIGELAHRLEDVLNLIRSGKIVPTSEVANPLLQAADMLKSMFEDVTASNDMDISEHLSQLQAILDGTGSAHAPGKGSSSPAPQAGSILAPFGLDEKAVLKKLENGQVYVVSVKPGKKKLDGLLEGWKSMGEVLGSHEVRKGEHAVLFATIMEPDMVPMALGVAGDALVQVKPDMARPAKAAPKPSPKAASKEAAKRTGPAPKHEKEPVPDVSEEEVPLETAGSGEEPEDQERPAKGKIVLKAAAEEEKKEENHSFITFSLENETYAVPIQMIEEIIGYQDISLLPNVPPFIKGVINLRGELVPVIDLRLKFGLEPKEYTPLTVFLIVRVDERVMGTVVDNVADVLVIDPSLVQQTPAFSAGIATDFIEGVYKDPQGQMVILVDIPSLIKPEEWVV